MAVANAQTDPQVTSCCVFEHSLSDHWCNASRAPADLWL